MGDAKSLEQEIDEYIKRIDFNDKEIERLENSIDTNKLDKKDKQKISEAKEKIDFARYKTNKVYNDISNLKKEICSVQEKIQNRNTEISSEELINLIDGLHYESSMAKSIERNNDFKEFLKENIKELKKFGYIKEKKITFKSGDLYNTMHGAMVKDIKIDSNGNITMRVEDLYNFEPNRPSVKGRLGEKYQNEGKIENYYVITIVQIPKSVWSKYYDASLQVFICICEKNFISNRTSGVFPG